MVDQSLRRQASRPHVPRQSLYSEAVRTPARNVVRRSSLLAVLVAGLVLPLTVPAPAAVAVSPPLPVGNILLQAHRGGPDLGAPENTVALFRLAVASGIVERIETDVHITKDNVLVIMHDQALPDRCSPFAGSAIHLLTWAQLQTVRCASVPSGTDGEPVPQLSEVFDTVRDTPVALNLELKAYDGITTVAKTDFAKRVARAVLASGLPKGKVMMSSYYWRSYAGPVQKYGKGITFSALEFTGSAQPMDKIFSTIRRAKSLGVDAFAGPMKYANEGLLAFIRGYGGMSVGLMDTKGDSDLRFALAHGLRNVTNDDPVKTRKSLDDLLASVEVNPLALKITETAVPVTTLLKKSMRKYDRSYPQLIGSTGPLPVTAARQLRAVLFTVTVTGKGSGTIELAPSGSRVGVDGWRHKIPKGTKTYTGVAAVPGDGGDLRVRATGTAKVTITVTGYQRADY